MIPIRDLNRASRRAVVTYSLIAINVAVFVYQLSMGDLLGQAFVERFGLVPLHLTSGRHLGSWVTPLTHIFIHGGILHAAGNMWFLHVFGDNVEDSLGRGRFVVFYLLCGFGAAAAQFAIDPQSATPMVGASGAIAGVLAAYVTLFPRARVVTLIPIFIFIQFVELPAYFFILIWFGYQILMGLTSFGAIAQHGGGVAFFAHIGGFLAGLVLVRILRRARHVTEGWRAPGTHYGRNARWERRDDHD